MATLRVTAGELHGRRVPVPPGELRPTSERARQAFFNIVARKIEGGRFLDLFSGSGIFAFEAVSRGAESATAVDHDRRQVEAIKKLAQKWEVPVSAVQGEVLATLPRLARTPFDVVYADPPYDYPDYAALVDGIERHLALGPDAIVAVEHRRRTNPFARSTGRLQPQRRAEHGEVWITFFA